MGFFLNATEMGEGGNLKIGISIYFVNMNGISYETTLEKWDMPHPLQDPLMLLTKPLAWSTDHTSRFVIGQFS